MSEYNYAVFDMAREQSPFIEFRRRLHVTERAPLGELEDRATGEPVGLDSLWAEGPAILEFGSFT